MSLSALIVSLLNAVVLGQSLLGTLLLAPKVRAILIYLPLLLFFLTNTIAEFSSLAMLPPLFKVAPFYSALIGFAAIPFHCLLAPLFWIYVRGLTSERSTIWFRSDLGHLALSFISLSMPLIAILMPTADLLALFQPGYDAQTQSNLQMLLRSAAKAIDIVVIVQVGFYIVLIIRRLAVYRKKLSELFASTEHLELRWFRWLAVFMFAYFVLSAFSALADSLLRSPHSLALWEALIDMALITTLCIWGLRQKPGLAIETQALFKDEQPSQKYKNSALSSDQCQSVADKIQNAMQNDVLYRQDDLSLRALAKHIGEMPSYVTQTLNTKIGASFFDYVNQWRINEAAQLLSNSEETVLTIAFKVGFNSRSSFYNSFKKNKGVTPTAYRKVQNKLI